LLTTEQRLERIWVVRKLLPLLELSEHAIAFGMDHPALITDIDCADGAIATQSGLTRASHNSRWVTS
jgi:hypothetical protein